MDELWAGLADPKAEFEAIFRPWRRPCVWWLPSIHILGDAGIDVMQAAEDGFAHNFAFGLNRAGDLSVCFHYLDNCTPQVVYCFSPAKTGALHATNAMARNGVQ